VTTALASKLDEWAQGSGCFLLEAPTGYGKSTQVMAWFDQREPDTPVIWLSGSSFLNTWEITWKTVLDALLDLGFITPETRAEATDLQHVFLILQRLERPVIVVYDNYHSLIPTRDFAIVEDHARQFPFLRNIFLSSEPVEATRSDPHRVTADRQDLAWSSDFARSVLGSDIGGSRLASRLDDVVAAAGGRASAILSFFREAHGSPTVDPLLGFQSRWLLERAAFVDPSGRSEELLLHLAQFVAVPVESLETMGFPDVAGLVSGLRREGLVSDASALRSVALAASDRAALLERSNEHFGSGLEAFHRSNAHVFLRSGSFALAAYHYARAGEYSLAAELLKRPARDSDGAAGITAVRLAFDAIPLERVADDLELLATRVFAAHLGPVADPRGRGEAEARLLSATAVALRQLSVRARTIVVAAMVVTLVKRGRAAEAVVRGRAASKVLSSLGWEQIRALGQGPGLLWTALAEAELLCANIHAAVELSVLAREWNGEVGHPYAALRACGVSAAASAISGDVIAAQAALDEAAYVTEMHGWGDRLNPPTLALARLTIAVAHWDPTLAGQSMLEFQRLTKDDAAWSRMTDVANSLTLLCADNAAEAFAASRIALAETDGAAVPPLIRHLAVIAHADALASLGRPGTVMSFLESVEEAPDHAFCYGARRANAALSMGDAQLAIQATDACVEQSHSHLSGTLASALLRRAVAKEILGLTHAADAAFAQALALLATSPRPAAFVNLNPELITPLWERADPRLVSATRRLADSLERPVSDHAPLEALTARELQVLAQLTVKATYREIGAALYLSENTVKTHVGRVYRKLGAGSRKEAVDTALRMGLVTVALHTD
jgi:LuxR family maltose regulon positive regulatory protein